MSHRDEPFHSAFLQHARTTLEAAILVRTLLSDLSRATEIADAIREAEQRGDEILRDVLGKVRGMWVTDLDRSDVHQLIRQLDGVLDLAKAVSERVVLFEIVEAKPEAIELADILVQACRSMVAAIEMLPRVGKSKLEILEQCGGISATESLADDVYRRALARLFKAGEDPLVVLKWRDIFDALENATDRCLDVANVLEGIVLEA